MQIIRTEVTQATAQTGQPILRVIFCGEGGDCVAVDLARVDGGNNEAAIKSSEGGPGPDRDLRFGCERL
ncbi:hypothetical protein [Mesorhizobium sp.]|uniref:hypothetical protein n=1 Tax=Mesorhizobium sp. TaxID=1871066 RepID=UPI000FE6C4F6|nr:hypothetical protein [Mesorhizobium sp.]RWB02841.1 MAG: hypothetical protein EOQ33_15940 [Mesorhizobium sp.]